MSKDLTDRQKEVLELMVSYYIKEDCFPTFREVCSMAGVTGIRAILDHFQALERKGWLVYRRKQTRCNRWAFSAKAKEAYGLTAVGESEVHAALLGSQLGIAQWVVTMEQARIDEDQPKFTKYYNELVRNSKDIIKRSDSETL